MAAIALAIGHACMSLRDAEIANIPFLAALGVALRRCSSLVWLATRRSERLALHRASAAKNGTLLICASLNHRATEPRLSERATFAPQRRKERVRLKNVSKGVLGNAR